MTVRDSKQALGYPDDETPEQEERQMERERQQLSPERRTWDQMPVAVP